MSFELRSRGCRGAQVAWEGHQAVVLENKHLRLVVSLTRGAEILELRDKITDEDLLWHGHPDVVRARPGIPTTALESGNFLEHFAGGWQEIFPTAGDPVEHRGARFGQHGEVALLPWEMSVVRDEESELAIDFAVRSRRYPMTLRRRVTIQQGWAGVRIEGTALNHSDQDLPIMWGHHIAIGGDWVRPGAVLHVPDGTAAHVPDYDWPGYRWRAGMHSWPDIPRRSDSIERVAVLPDDDGSEGHLILGPLSDGTIRLESPRLGREVTFRWPAADFPYAWCWFVYRGHPDWPLWGQHRLITIEPFTSELTPLNQLSATGRATVLHGNSSMRNSVEVEFGSS